jgi:hypothetical protein
MFRARSKQRVFHCAGLNQRDQLGEQKKNGRSKGRLGLKVTAQQKVCGDGLNRAIEVAEGEQSH